MRFETLSERFVWQGQQYIL